jgi:hypothetical protein
MENLNDRVEGIFRGVVLIVLSFLTSIALMIVRPIDGYAELASRIRRRSQKENQVRPYAFAFFAISLVFFSPSLMDSVARQVASPFEYQVHDSTVPDNGALGRAYETATQKIESKAATAIFVATIVGVVGLHLCATGSGFLLLGLRARRETWRDALFFVGGLQITMFLLVTLIDRLGWPSVTEIGLVRNFLVSPLTLWHSNGHFYPVYLDVLDTTLLILLLLLPFGMAGRFALRLSIKSENPRTRLSSWARTIGLVLLIDSAVVGSLSAAAYVADEIQPRSKPAYPFSIQNVDCTLESNASKLTITGSSILKADSRDAWTFDTSDFTLFVAADRTDTDGPARSKSPVLSSTRIGAGKQLVTSFTAISPNFGRPPFLLQAGQSTLIRFETEVSPDLEKFLSSHPDAQRCTLSYVGDYPIGAIGPLRSKD